jgi:cyclohexyl-isocyanide hydratase
MSDPFRILFAVFPGMTQLDFTGPHQFLSRAPNSVTTVASVLGGTLDAADGLSFANLAKLAEVERCDLLCVPGGTVVAEVAKDHEYMRELKRLAATATYITSVCTGSLLLAAAGLLKNKRAACHWAWRDMLPIFGAIPDTGRVVRDGNIITGGGVTAGIDFALTVLSEIAGPTVAQAIQLGLEYAPQPPFNSGRPETAPAEVLALYQAATAQSTEKRRAAFEQLKAD